MIVRRYTDPVAYRDRVAAYLEREAAANNLALGIVYRLAEPAHREEQPPLLALVEEEGEVALVVLMTPPYNVIVVGSRGDLAPTRPPWPMEEEKMAPTQPLRPTGEEKMAPTPPPPRGEGSQSSSPRGGGQEGVVGAAVSFLLREGISPPGVIGARTLATRFAAAWCARAGGRAQVRSEQMIYRLDHVNPIAYSPGSLVQATGTHLDLLTEWLVGFSKVTPHPLSRDGARKRVAEMVDAGRLYLWHDAAPVSMAWRARPTRSGITVSGVYTPPALRRRGYATSCVAALSQLLLDEGYTYCTLYTDLANPTSNHIYQEIGYRPIQASIDIVFVAGSSS
jgi:GNAT superfamily N-acetyltransferase